MIIKEIAISNIRCIREETLKLDPLTILVGANGVGKSSFLNALNLFYSQEDSIKSEDFFADDTNKEAIIAITFTNLSAQAKSLFQKYIEADELTVLRVFKWKEGKTSGSYHGAKLQIPEFNLVRKAGSATDAKLAYTTLVADARFNDLPVWSKQSTALEELEKWEGLNPGLCQRCRDDGQFFGYKSVSVGYLGRFTRFLMVPAVRNAAIDGEEGKNSLFGQLIDLAIRSNSAGTDELTALRIEMKQRYEAIIDTTHTAELKRIQDELSKELSTYVAGSGFELSWDEMPHVQLPPPKAIAKVGEEGHISSIERKGHGLQRAFIITLLQYLESIQQQKKALSADTEDEINTPSLIIGIEEPELYQHPDRQRHFFKILSNLARINSPDLSSTQIVYTTHSPHFVGLNMFDHIRLIRKKITDKIPEAYVTSVTLDEIATQLQILIGGTVTFTGSTLKARLQTLMTPWMNEGFFSRMVVLVEGESDRAAILAAANLMGHDLESMGISIIPCMGKANIDRAALVFKNFGIPVYIVWDNDKGETDPKPEINHRLLKLLGEQEVDYPSGVYDQYSCLDSNLESTIENDLTKEAFDRIVLELQEEYEIKKKDVLKNPLIMTELISKAQAENKSSSTISAIVKKIISMYPKLS